MIIFTMIIITIIITTVAQLTADLGPEGGGDRS
jgi:hypothetical protein